MKKFYTLLAACLLSLSAACADYEIVYTVFDAQTGTLTYYYDYESKRKEVGGEVYDTEKERFVGYAEDIKKVVIDESMKKAYKLSKANQMFFSGNMSHKLTSLTEIEGMENFVSEDVTDMSEMFYGCSALKSIDLSHLITRNVTNMESMFEGCSSLESLDLSYFWTHNVTNMNFMFYECTALKSVNLSALRTENVKEMNSMFFRCKNLTELDVAGFDMNKVTIISGMFGDCEKLKTIYCNHFWTNIGMDADDLFDGCTSLVGEHGTVYDEDHTYLDYARPDSKNGNPGYFTTKKETFAYLDEKSGTLSFLYGIGRQFLPTAQLVPIQLVDDEMQELYQTKIKKLKFDDGMTDSPIKTAKALIPRTRYQLIAPYRAVEKIDGLEKINTSVLTNWERMFYSMNLKEIDLTEIDMGPVTDVTDIFSGCKELETIYCNDDWNERSDWKIWTGDGNLFRDCEKLKGGNGTTYDFNHKGFSYAHPDVEGNPGYFTATLPPNEIYAVFDDEAKTMTLYYDRLKEERGGIAEWWDDNYEETREEVTGIILDESMQNAKPTSTCKWFYYCSNASEIRHLDYLNTSEVTDMNCMFMYCGKLKSIDLSSFNTEKVTDMCAMFWDCYSLKRIDLSKFNTSNVTSMRLMFASCRSLTTLDVRKFDVSKVTDMYQMFRNCWSLVALYGTEDWALTAPNGVSSGDMFGYCEKLPHYDDDNANDITFAHPDEEGNPGYFCTTSPKMLYGWLDDSDNILTIRYDRNKDIYPISATPEEWYRTEWSKEVTKVTFNESVRDAEVYSTEDWFDGFTSLTEVEHLDYLHSEHVISTANMFRMCTSLRSLAIPMSEDGDPVFYADNTLGMFCGCQNLETLDLTGLNTWNADNLIGMFAYCINLKTIYCNADWPNSGIYTIEEREADYMFLNCNSLVGGNGTKYSETLKGIEYARPDIEGQPGYFTSKTGTAIEQVQHPDASCSKLLRDGQLLILRDGKTFNTLGIEQR